MEKDVLKKENEQVDKMLEMNILTPQNCSFKLTKGGFVSATIDGKKYDLVNIIRAFPLSDADRYLSVRLPDGKQEELGIIEKLSDFDDDTVSILEKQLKLRYFRPKINRIISIKEEFGHAYWTVETDKGKVKFASSSGSAGAVIHHGKGIIIKDASENRYEIEDLSKLTAAEMKKLDLYL